MYKKIYITALALSLLAGCKEAPDLVLPSDRISTSGYPTTIGELQEVLTPGYGNLRSIGLWGFQLMPKALEVASHNGDNNYTGDGAWNEMARNNLSVSNDKSESAWRSLYAGVTAMNVALQAAKDLEAKGGASKAEIDLVVGQALFLRAFYYFHLQTLFGEAYLKAGGANDKKMGVPLYKELPGNVDATQQPRATAREVWNFIIEDLKQSSTLLKGKVWDAANRGRVTEWSAKALMGKAYVFTEDWANAKTVLLDVIQNSGKTLMPYAKYKDAFNGNTANEFNEESLFELNVDADNKNNYGPWGGSPNASTLNGVIWSAYIIGADGTETGARPLGYGGNLGVHEKNVQRFGYPLGGGYALVPNPAFDATQPASYKNPARVMDPVYKAQAIAVRTNKTADPRLYVNLVQPWVDVLNTNFDAFPTYPVPVAKAGWLTNTPNAYGWGYRKYAAIDYHLNLVNYDKWNWYFLRLADIYLLYAEASIGSGDAATGLEYINKVHRRAYSFAINSPSPVDYTSISAATPATDDPVLGNSPLRYERWAELFHEGHWWFDVQRWRLGPAEASFYQTASYGAAPLSFNETKNYAWPIPLSEFASNAKIAGQQNPGY